MTYQVLLYVKGKKKEETETICSAEYLEGLKKEIFDNEIKFLDLETVIIPKSEIAKIEVNKISDN